MSATHAIPPDHADLMPYLVVHDAARAIDFYRNMFGAVSTHLRDVPPDENGCGRGEALRTALRHRP